MSSVNNIPSKLKEYRKKNNLSQNYVAEQLNLSRQAISNWEKGKTTPSINDFISLSKLYNVSLDELVDARQPKDSQPSFDFSPILPYLSFLETLGIIIILILFSQIPIISIVVPILIFVWLKRTSRNKPLIYILCILCLIIGLYNSYIFVIHFIPSHGTPIIQQV